MSRPSGGSEGLVGASRTLALLESGELEVLGLLPRASNFTFLARVSGDDEQALAVYKPRSGEAPLWDFPAGSLAAREVAAFVVASDLGWPRVPPTVATGKVHGSWPSMKSSRFKRFSNASKTVPACTRAERASLSTSRIWFIRRKSITIPACTDNAPPMSPDPPP